ncbi:hypothetical protein H4R19_003759 [Coemansia spiralis]|nr:hypothetical protein H4R19_003759 [Coemansia spiralis]
MFVAGRKRKAQGDSPAPGRAGQRARTSATPVGDDQQRVRAEIGRLLLLGAENTRERQHRTALDYYNRAVALAKNEGIEDARLYEARSHALYKLGEYSRAMDDAKDAIRANAGAAAGYTRMATILAMTGKPGDALVVVDRGLAAVGAQDAGHAYLETQRMSILRLLDPAYVPPLNTRTDPVVRLPSDVAVLVLGRLDLRALLRCRAVARHWMALIDATPGLWSRPTYVPLAPGEELLLQVPGSVKLRRLLGKQQQASSRVPDWALRLVFERSRGGLAALCIPNGTEVTAATLDALFEHKRPRLATVDIGQTASLASNTVDRVLRWCYSAQLTEIRVPYREDIDSATMAAIARGAPALRILDISGCVKVRVKQLFRAWNPMLEDAQESTTLEELYMNDHPGVLELLVYSTKYNHFGGLRILHMAVTDRLGPAGYPGLGPLLEYFRRIPNPQVPFPALVELNIDRVWDLAPAARRFDSNQAVLLITILRLLCAGLRRLSALESSAIGDVRLFASLHGCFPTLRQLHLSRALNLDAQVLTSLVGAHEALPLVSLDLNGCIGVDAYGLALLVSRCRRLVHVNLSHTTADNTVLAALTEAATSDDAAGLELLLLDTTNVTGAAVRDFAAACAKRYCRMRRNTHAPRVWRLRLLDVDNCSGIATDAVAAIRDLLSFMRTRVLAAVPG